jgi:hypothetical protein
VALVVEAGDDLVIFDGKTFTDLPVRFNSNGGQPEVIQAFGIDNPWPDRGYGSRGHQQWSRRGYSRDADCRLRQPIAISHRWESLNAVPVFPAVAVWTEYPVGAVRDLGRQ